jgi:hypothetical protein
LVVAACLLTSMLLAHRASAASYAPVAAYSFDEGEAAGTTVEDQAGENEGTLEGVVRTPDGRYGGALAFHGNEGECASVPDSESLQLKEEFTIEAWVKSNWLVGEPIVYKETEGYWSYWFGIALGQDGRPEAWIADEEGGEWEVRAPSAVEAGVWTHLAVTWDGARLRLYVDGTEVASHAAPASGLSSKGPLWIGCAPPNTETFDGRIDELRIYDRVLDQADIAADMEAPIETPKAGPVAEYSFDGGEAAGTTLEDLAGEDDGTIEGADWTTGRYGGALSFEHPEDCVTVPGSEALGLGEEATVEAWVKPTGTLAADPIVFKESSGQFSYAMGLGFTHEGRAEGWIRYEGEEEEVYSPGDIEVGVWSHLALTYDGSRLRIYVDGKLAASHTLPEPGATLTSEGPLHIGCAPAYNENFRGRIDEVRLYERALGEGEVLGDMEAPIQTPRQAPVAEYSFDGGEEAGTALEDLAGENDGTIEGGTEWARGRYGESLRFANHEGECVSVPNSAALGLGEELTIEAWVKPDSLVSEPIVYKETEGYWSYWFGIALGQEGRPEANIADEGGEEWNVRSPTSIEVGVWSHLAVTYDGAHMRLYVDGEEVATKAVPGATLKSEGPLYIGCAPPNTETFDGRIDELRIYQRALDSAEVAADMETPIQTPKAGPVAEYSFDEDSGTVLHDVSGNGNEGTIEGAEWAPGKYGSALEFDPAQGDVVTIPDSEGLRLSEEFTLEAWVRPAEGHPEMPVLGKAGSGQYGYGLFANGDEGSSLHPMGFVSHDQFVNSHAYSPTDLPTNAWSHLAVTDDGAHIRLYVDGQLTDERASEEVLTGTGPLQIGGDEPVAEGGLFDGRIDEVRIYDRGLNAAEVGADMEAPIQTPKSDPIAAWGFNEGEGSIAQDASGDEHLAAIDGAEWANGKYGDGLQFDGDTDVVTVPYSPEFDLTEAFTLEAWVRPESESDEWAPILAKEIGGGEAAEEIAWWLYEGGSQPNVPFGGTESAPGVRNKALGEDPLPVDVWSHLALTYDGSQVALYVDGELVDCSQAPSEGPRSSEGELEIGGVSESGDFYKGRIDEVHIYDRAISRDEVIYDMDTPVIMELSESYAVEVEGEGEEEDGTVIATAALQALGPGAARRPRLLLMFQETGVGHVLTPEQKEEYGITGKGEVRIQGYRFNYCPDPDKEINGIPLPSKESMPGKEALLKLAKNGESRQCHNHYNKEDETEYLVTWAVSASGIFFRRPGREVWVKEPPDCKQSGPFSPEKYVDCEIPKWRSMHHLDVIGDWRFENGKYDASIAGGQADDADICARLNGVLPINVERSINGEEVFQGNHHGEHSGPHWHYWLANRFAAHEPCYFDDPAAHYGPGNILGR